MLVPLALASVAHAHHPGPSNGGRSIGPRSRLFLDVEVAEYNLDGRTGNWQMFAPSFELALHRRFSLFMRMPVARVDDRIRGVSVGVADWDLGAKVLAASDEESGFVLTTGLGIELPTGSTNDGLGNGHVEFSPFIATGLRPLDNVSLAATVTGRFSTGGSHAHEDSLYGTSGVTHEDGEPGHAHALPAWLSDDGAADHSVLSPHAQHEMAVRLSGWYQFGPAYLGVGSEVTLQFTGESPWGPVLAIAELGVLVGETQFSVALDLPIAGEHRYEWHGVLNATWFPQ